MANTKISQLPIWSGTARDLRWFVMNNSGESETYKFSGYSAQLIPGTGTNSYRTPTQTASGLRSIAIGEGASATGEDSVCIGNIGGEQAGFRSVIIGRHFQTAAANRQLILGSGSYTTGDFSMAIGHETAASGGGIAIGSNTTRATGNHSITIGNANERGIGAFSSTIGYGNKIGDAPNFNPGSYNNIIASNSIINPTNNTYNYNNIFGGFGNIISGTTSGTTLIGLVNYTQPLESDTVYLNNLQVLRTPSTRVQSVSSGTTFTCNLNNGGKSQFYITGTSTINITNVRDGQSFMIKTQTDGNYVMTWTATGGYTFVFEGGIKDPGNTTTDIFVFEVFGSVIYGSRRHNFT